MTHKSCVVLKVVSGFSCAQTAQFVHQQAKALTRGSFKAVLQSFTTSCETNGHFSSIVLEDQSAKHDPGCQEH